MLAGGAGAESAGAPEPPPAMGSAESREGRRASFGMDEEERVRVLQGIRVSGRPAGGRLEACRLSAARGPRGGGRLRPGLLRVTAWAGMGAGLRCLESPRIRVLAAFGRRRL